VADASKQQVNESKQEMQLDDLTIDKKRDDESVEFIEERK